ncbi:MAG: dihydrodipicolinate synthase family protein [Chloroflexi bacterium]|nr:dihydrodipicolinate synthase family protein [Chloroflexota bacterium]
MVDWAGTYPAMMTMFDAQGRVDEDATAAHADRLVHEGVQGLVAAGTSGEFILLDADERLRVIRAAIAGAAGRVPVIAGTGAAATHETIALTEQAAAAGAVGAIVILPYYLKPTMAEILGHFRAVGAASPVPIMVYNNPANSAAPAIEPPALAELYHDGLVASVKSTFPTVHQVHELRALTDEGFRVFYGSFMAPLEGMAGGAHGWVSGILNVAARDAVALHAAMQAGDLVAARAAWARILPIKLLWTRSQLGHVSDIAMYRTILRLRGQVAGHCRAPVLELSDDQVTRLRSILEPFGLLEA